MERDIIQTRVTHLQLGCDRMVVRFTTTCVISAYRHQSCEFEFRSWRGVLDTTLCDKKFVSDLRQVVVISGYSDFLHQ